MARSTNTARPTRTSSLLLVALGAATGVALALLLSRARRSPPGTRRGRGASQAQRLDRAQDRRTRSVEADAMPTWHDPDEGFAPTHTPPRVPAHDDLEQRVLEVFCHDPILQARAIDIGAVGNGAIELAGWVASTAEIAHALTLTRGVPGVTRVLDRLAVSGSDPRHDHRAARYEPPRH
ncbi:MAG: BON domain-containing protein [Gemmatimonadota bacterium]|nr:BON domain-containing protein [Gemmatimonadota bacterium]